MQSSLDNRRIGKPIAMIIQAPMIKDIHKQRTYKQHKEPTMNRVYGTRGDTWVQEAG